MSEVARKQLLTTFFAIVATLGPMLTSVYNLDLFKDRLLAANEIWDENFDFIIIGAGSSGSVVANRLSKFHRVLLLEFGGEPSPFTYFPGFATFLLNYPETDWMHQTVPQKAACLAGVDQKSGWSQGKGLGGTSNINFMIASRGCPKDYDNWADITGDSSWSYEGVLPFFKKSENFQGIYRDSGFHGTSGPVSVTITPEPSNSNVFVRAGQDFGYPQADLNGNFTEGFDTVYYNIKKGRRHGNYPAYIKPVRYRRSLTIAKFAHVRKILINDNLEAVGVEFDRHLRRRQAFARKEVILSAGAIQSPKLLMLSGIGPRAHLEQFDIPVKMDSPQVGQNLQDHISVYLGPFFTNPGTSTVIERDISVLREAMKFVLSGKGIISSTSIHGQAFFATSSAKEKGLGDWPDIQLLFGGISVYKDFAEYIAQGFYMDADKLKKYYEHAVAKDSFLIIISLARPVQRGEILLKSGNPEDPLHIDPKYLEDKADISVLVEGVKMVINIVENARSFQEVGAKFTSEPFPGCESEEFRSDAYWECFIRQYTISLHHIGGTCAMGSRESNSVLTSDLKVRGVKNLRVVDASIMPVIPVGNTHVPSTMIGEMGSDLILKDWKFR